MDWQQNSEGQTEEFVVPPYALYEFKFKQEQTSYSCDTLIVATYGASSLFAHSLSHDKAPINRLNFSRAKQQALADLYTSQSHLLLIFNDTPQTMKESFFYKFIAQYFTFKKLVILSSISKTVLRNPSPSNLNYISSSAFPQTPQLPRFKDGVMGLQADLLQWCELNKIPICGFIGIFGEYELSSEIIETVFGSLRGKYGILGQEDISEQVKRYNMKKASSKLYL